MIAQMRSIIELRWGGPNEDMGGGHHVGQVVKFHVAADFMGEYEIMGIRLVEIGSGMITVAIALRPVNPPEAYDDPKYAVAFVLFKTIMNPSIVVDYEVQTVPL